jgi:hypothetical protein
MDINVRVDFPALDRLCGILEGKTGAGLCAEVKVDVGGSVDVCAEKGEERAALETTPVETTPSPSAPPGPAGPFFAENYPLDSFPGARTPSAEGELREPKPAAKAKGKTRAEARSEVTKEPAPAPAPEPAPEPVPAEKTYVLEDLQRAAASLRDQGKLGAVTALFPEYGIRKLSDLKAEQMAGFASELKRLGAEL